MLIKVMQSNKSTEHIAVFKHVLVYNHVMQILQQSNMIMLIYLPRSSMRIRTRDQMKIKEVANRKGTGGDHHLDR